MAHRTHTSTFITLRRGLIAGLVMLASTALPSLAHAATAATACPAVLNHTVKKLQDDSPMDLCQYAGKVVLVVNVASFCGFVGQYAPLERLYKQYKNSGLVVLGFPSNDFGKQEPGSAKEIADFCVNTYGVEFPMTSKTVVSGKDAHPMYKALAAATKGETPSWNFHKYLIARDGKTVDSYSTMTSPDSAKVIKQIERLLAEK
jgi:glutathione peroxidase